MHSALAKDFEASIEGTLSWLYIASVKLMSRRLGRVSVNRPHDRTHPAACRYKVDSSQTLRIPAVRNSRETDSVTELVHRKASNMSVSVPSRGTSPRPLVFRGFDQRFQSTLEY